MLFRTDICRRGAPLRDLFTASEAFAIKNFLNTFQVRQWNKPYAEVDRTSPDGSWTIFIPQGGGEGGDGRRTFRCRKVDVQDYELNPEGDPIWRVRIAPGHIVHGDVAHLFEGADVEVPEDEGEYWIYISLAYSTDWAITAGCTEDDEYPVSGANEYLTVLRAVIVDDEEEFTLSPITNHSGDIHIHGAFAP